MLAHDAPRRLALQFGIQAARNDSARRLLWTSLDTREIDRRFNFQIVRGAIPGVCRAGGSERASFRHHLWLCRTVEHAADRGGERRPVPHTSQIPMAYDERLAERVRQFLKGRRGISEKKMFGGVAFLVRGNMCCEVNGDELMVRVGPDAYGGRSCQMSGRLRVQNLPSSHPSNRSPGLWGRQVSLSETPSAREQCPIAGDQRRQHAALRTRGTRCGPSLTTADGCREITAAGRRVAARRQQHRE